MTDIPPSYSDTITNGPPRYNATWASATSSSQSRAQESAPASRSRHKAEASSSNVPNTSTQRRPRPADPDKTSNSTAAAPETYPIGKTRTQPLVFIPEVRGHLALLRAFAKLRSQIDAYDIIAEYAVPFMPEDRERRWAWFVGLAVERFAAWCVTLSPLDAECTAEDFLPPLDVIMVWHTYMLNPGWYAEDRARDPTLSALTHVGSIFSSSLSFQLEEILAAEPTTARLQTWTTRTARAFDPLEDANLHPTKEIRCPKCRREIDVAYMDMTCNGYLQQNFFVRCTAASCRDVPRITKAVLGARKFAEDLVMKNPGERKYLAGTLRTPLKAVDHARGKAVKAIVAALPKFTQPPENDLTEAWVVSILEKHKYDLESMRSEVAGKMHLKSASLIRRIFSAYRDGERFSVDLVGAVIRQGGFIRKIHELRWTDPTYFTSDVDAVALRHAIARYHGFLDLLAASPEAAYVPTLDIDLVWHTHQLMGPEYNSDCKANVGRYIDHDDKVEEDALANGFDATCRAWKDRFHVPYSHCGCPIPGESIRRKLHSLRTLHTPKPPAHLDLPPLSASGATHPSDHNAVFLFHRRNAGLEARAHRLEKGWRRAERHGRKQGGEHDHDSAFLAPVPEWWAYPKEVVCAATPGNVVNNPGGSVVGECAGGGGACVVASWGSEAG